MYNQLKVESSELLAGVRDVLALAESGTVGPLRECFEALDKRFWQLRTAVLEEQAKLDMLAQVLGPGLGEGGVAGRHLAPFKAVLEGPSRLAVHVLNNVTGEMGELYLAWAKVEFESGSLEQAARVLAQALRILPFDSRAKALLAALHTS